MKKIKRPVVKLNISFVLKLTNKEFETLMYRIITRLGEVEIGDDKIVAAIENANMHMPILTELGQNLKAHPLTEEVNTMSSECRDNLLSIRFGIESFDKAGSESKKAAAKILKQWIKKERRDLGTRSKGRQVAAVNRLKAGVAKSESIEQALAELELTERFETAARLCERIENLSLVRDRDRYEIKKLRDQRKAMCYEDLGLVTTLLSVNANQNRDEENALENVFYNICLDIKSLLDSTHAILKSRNTRYVNEKASLEDEPDQNVGGESSPDSDTTEVA